MARQDLRNFRDDFRALGLGCLACRLRILAISGADHAAPFVAKLVDEIGDRVGVAVALRHRQLALKLTAQLGALLSRERRGRRLGRHWSRSGLCGLCGLCLSSCERLGLSQGLVLLAKLRRPEALSAWLGLGDHGDHGQLRSGLDSGLC